MAAGVTNENNYSTLFDIGGQCKRLSRLACTIGRNKTSNTAALWGTFTVSQVDSFIAIRRVINSEIIEWRQTSNSIERKRDVRPPISLWSVTGHHGLFGGLVISSHSIAKRLTYKINPSWYSKYDLAQSWKCVKLFTITVPFMSESVN